MSCLPLLPHHPPCCPSSVDTSQTDIFSVAFLDCFPVHSKTYGPLPGTSMRLPCLLKCHSALPCRHVEGSLLCFRALSVTLRKPGSVPCSISHPWNFSYSWDPVFVSLLHSFRGIPHLICYHHISVPSIVSAQRRHSIYILKVYKLYLWYKKHLWNLPLIYHCYEDKINFLT